MSVLQNLLLAISIFTNLLSWILMKECPHYFSFPTRQLCKRGKGKDELYTTTEFRKKSHIIILTNCNVINDWFLAMMQAFGYGNFKLYLIQSQTVIFVENILTIAYIWFAKTPRKPPYKIFLSVMYFMYLKAQQTC